MPEADTIDRVKSRKVQVASLPPADSGRGFARLPDRLMDDLGLAEHHRGEDVHPRTVVEEARQVTIPLLVLLQWDDEGNDRQMALDLFDTFGSKEKALHANLGGHTGVPQFEGDDGNRFFARHLK